MNAHAPQAIAVSRRPAIQYLGWLSQERSFEMAIVVIASHRGTKNIPTPRLARTVSIIDIHHRSMFEKNTYTRIDTTLIIAMTKNVRICFQDNVALVPREGPGNFLNMLLVFSIFCNLGLFAIIAQAD